MNPIDLKLPAEAKKKGALYPILRPEHLDSEAMEIELPSVGVFIDVGWYPSGDPSGQFYVTAFRGHWDYRIKRLTTRSPREAASMVEALVERYTSATDRYFTTQANTVYTTGSVSWDGPLRTYTAAHRAPAVACG